MTKKNHVISRGFAVDRTGKFPVVRTRNLAGDLGFGTLGRSQNRSMSFSDDVSHRLNDEGDGVGCCRLQAL